MRPPLGPGLLQSSERPDVNLNTSKSWPKRRVRKRITDFHPRPAICRAEHPPQKVLAITIDGSLLFLFLKMEETVFSEFMIDCENPVLKKK